MNKTIAKHKEHLKTLIEKEIEIHGYECSLNHIDTHQLHDLSNLFSNEGKFTQFNGDISQWDVSNVLNMNGLFRQSIFNGDISNWDTSKVKNMQGMFAFSKFNNDISKWDVSNVSNMTAMFYYSVFNQDISNWDVSKVESMMNMFAFSKFNGDVSSWDVSNVKHMGVMFGHSKFNQDLTLWKPIKVDFTFDMFKDCQAPVPYWVEAKNIPKAVREYFIEKNFAEIDHVLSEKNIKQKKVKI